MEKYAFTMQLLSGNQVEYKRRHDEIWPALATLLRDAGVCDYSIHLNPATDQLFAVLWRRGNHTMEALPRTQAMQDWWAFMADLMVTNPDNSPVTMPLDNVFHLP
ncbi:L-rhamnose mutarotase [Loktanella salsilacus]|uniref:L-rhamnose mutarotase n=1 Tax=Loktanella salsilacus TaxID=195913 RepID=A0A1I4J885_9RHOB|nr:L-rhamnose mutarotase [Loktanella salsilacus]SFL62792.1 L-rhamnose mutarotase [Loktanella salsilacus]